MAARSFPGPWDRKTLYRAPPPPLSRFCLAFFGWWMGKPIPAARQPQTVGIGDRLGFGVSASGYGRSMEQDIDTTALKALLDDLTGALDARHAVVVEKIGELRRLNHANPHRRGGLGSVDAQKYALGSVLAMLGVTAIEEPNLDTRLLGLLAHPVQMMRWMARLIEVGIPPHLDRLIDAIFADRERAAWCEQWGRILQWRYRAPLYRAAVQSFLDSGRTGPSESWRRRDITEDQANLILTLVGLLDEPAPALTTRGEAFDWIYARGGNPAYWAEPGAPEGWENGNA